MTLPLNPDTSTATIVGNRWLTASELAAYLDVSLSWVRQCSASAGIRKYRLGSLVRYDRQQVDSLMMSGRVKRHE